MPTIQIAVNRGGKDVREPVEAELFEVDGLKLAVHERTDYTGWWIVTEPQTGMCIGDSYPSREKAIEQASKRVRLTGIEKVKQIIADEIAKQPPADTMAKQPPEPAPGKLVGTTAEKIRDEAVAYPHERGNLHYTEIVALAAQKAMVDWIFGEVGVVGGVVDADDAGDVWDRLMSLPAKLGVTS